MSMQAPDNTNLKWTSRVRDMKINYDQNNISLRDHFAGLAMQGLVGKPSWDLEQFKQDPKRIAAWSYDIADEMLVIRNKEERNTLLDK